MPEIDVTPEKRVFLSVITEYDLNKGICELIDNAIDQWTKNQRPKLAITLSLDRTHQSILIKDNAGGVPSHDLGLLFSPGRTTNELSDNVIGYFGVGIKRAVVALAQDITVKTRYADKETCIIHFDDEWINDNPLWKLTYNVANKNLSPNTTLIELFKLRVPVDDESIRNLKIHLSEVYGLLIDAGLQIIVDGDLLDSITFENNWTYPPKYLPASFSQTLYLKDRQLDVQITTGLINHSGYPDNSYGLFFYCNRRLITRGLTDFSVGFESGKIGNPHYNISLVRTIVKLKGQSRDMPWNSSKSSIDTKHPIFQELRTSIINVTSNYAKACRAFQGKWDEEFFPYKKGKISKETSISVTDIPRNYRPVPPAHKPRWQQRVINLNEPIVSEKPWSSGLQDSIIAVDVVSKLLLEQKNRIALVILDSTLEIAYKEYLINEQGLGIGTFKRLNTRSDIQDEVFKTITVSTALKKKIEHYYRLRNDLIHQRATPNVGDDDIKKYRKIVEELLFQMFGLQFDI
jgi:hypothetical protein